MSQVPPPGEQVDLTPPTTPVGEGRPRFHDYLEKMGTSGARLAPSLLSADLSRLGEEVADLERAGADRVHWDVMDGRFVPNLTFGPDVIAAARAHTTLPFEAHLMVDEPERMLGRWVEAGCQTITVHVESTPHLHRALQSIGELGARAGVAVNPSTPANRIEHVLDLVDLVLVMTVNPGFGGQRYLVSMAPKIEQVRRMIVSAGRPVELEVDGGINAKTIDAARCAGAEVFVVGSALYSHPDGPHRAIRELRERCEPPTEWKVFCGRDDGSAPGPGDLDGLGTVPAGSHL